MNALKKKVYLKKNVKTYSISTHITLSLIVTVTLVSTLSIIAIYSEATFIANKNIEIKTDEIIEYLDRALVLPLWDTNYESVKMTGSAITQNDHVCRLVIKDYRSNKLYSFDKACDDDSVNRYRKIYHRGNLVGEIELALSKRSYKENQQKLLLRYVIITLFIICILGIVSGFFVRTFLKKPLASLNDIVNSYAKGRYDLTVEELPYREFKLFGNILTQMGAKINEQIIKLHNTEKKVRKANLELEARVQKRTAELLIAKEDAEASKLIAEEAARVKSDFLAKMSHEIRTPMNAIFGLTDLTLNTELEPLQRDYLSKVVDSSRHLLRIINDILDFSKIEADKLELEHTDFMLHHVIDKMANMFRAKAAEKRLELFYVIDSHVPLALKGDPFRLGQILINLISNAVKFTEQGEIIIKVELNTENVTVKPGPDQVDLLFWVQDSGIGIPPDQMETLFEPFTQLDGSMTRKYEGSGLGLSICYKLVNLLGGQIWVESEIGHGSVFYFNSLLNLGTEIKPYQLDAPVDIRGLKVLVVDDNETARQILEHMLRQFEFEVTTASSGQQGLTELARAAEEKPFDLLLVDWKMPKMDGFELVENIRNHPLLGKEAATPKIILITMYGRDEIIQAREGTAVTIDEYLLKPISSSELFNTIMEIFGRAEAIVPRTELEPESVEVLGVEGIKGARVLLVEDHEINLQVALAIMERAGLLVEVARNGREAVNIMKVGIDADTPFYDAVLMDIEMPVMDGYEATRQIRQLELIVDDSADPPAISHEPSEGSERVPIIAMTAHALEGDRETCLAAGMDDYIAKPIDIREFYATLVKWIKPGERESTEPFSSRQVMVEPWNDLPTEIPGINLKMALARIYGDSGLYKKMLLSFVEKFDNAELRIGQYISEGKLDEAYQLVHGLKGVSANIGAENLFKTVRNLCGLLETKKTEELPSVLASFSRQFSSVITTLRGLPLETQLQKLSSDQIEQADPDKVNVVLSELLQLIEEKDYEMMEVFQTLKKILHGSRFNDRLIILDRTIYNMDFKKSIALVKELMEEFEV